METVDKKSDMGDNVYKYFLEKEEKEKKRKKDTK